HVMSIIKSMEREGIEILKQSGVNSADIKVYRSCDMKYVGQNHEINVPIPDGVLNNESNVEIKENFNKKYSDLYSESSEEFEIETFNWRVVVQGPIPEVFLKYGEVDKNEHTLVPKNKRNVYFKIGR